MSSKSYRLLGLDLSLNGTGLAKTGGFTDVCRVKKMRGMNRVAYVANWVAAHIRDDHFTHAFVEDYAYNSKKSRYTFSAGELGGVVKLILLARGIPVVTVPPKTLKKWVTGTGNADKELMMQTITERWGMDFDDDNAADAFALTRYGAYWIQHASVRGAKGRKLMDDVEYIAVTKELQAFANSVSCSR